MNIKDEYGDLTFNVGTIKKENDNIIATIDIRFPVTKNSNDVLSYFKYKNTNGIISFDEKYEPLFYELDSKLVTKLYEAYKEVSKDETKKPLVIGGGTYAKSMKNCVAFGPGNIDVDNHIHDVDEFVDIDDLCKQVDYYVTAILKLLEIN